MNSLSAKSPQLRMCRLPTAGFRIVMAAFSLASTVTVATLGQDENPDGSFNLDAGGDVTAEFVF